MQQGNIDSHCFRQKSTRDRISRSVECEINLCERHTLNHSLSRLLNFSPAVRKPGGIYFTPADLSKLVAVFKRYEGTWRGPKLSSGPLPMTGCSKFHHSFLVPYETYWVFFLLEYKGWIDRNYSLNARDNNECRRMTNNYSLAKSWDDHVHSCTPLQWRNTICLRL